MALWKTPVSLEILNENCKNTLAEAMGLVITEVGDDYVKGTIPVDRRTVQPFGLLHGGASVALAETLGSIGGGMTVKMPEEVVVGLEINANHVRGAKTGIVTGIARPVHIGGRTQIWEIRITNEADELVCISRLTLAVIRQK